MSWRTVVITNRVKLDCKMGSMVIRGEDTKRINLDEIAILLIENPAVSLTGCLLEALTERKVRVIFCDSKRSPMAELVPHHGSHDSTLKIRAQAAWPEYVKAEVWREIVCEKIRNQSLLLSQLGMLKEAGLLDSYIPQVEPRDSTNREGHATKVYFNALFGMSFTRSASSPLNGALNYGYSILLSAFNREIAANGYLTQLGIFHDNMFNHFNLASDLMEPFRILIDREVRNLMPETLEKEEKHALWRVLEQNVYISRSKQTVLNAVKLYTRSVFEAMNSADPSQICFFDMV
ncbi:MAG: type II CRISPR-associated endonuclease Cas1 [Clostridiales bacterium]|nr:type II CRISPR-associated endonuclease Cas1 [Clostridiales bacterium]